MHAKNSEKVLVTMARKGEWSFREHITPAKKEDDGNTH